MGGGHRRSQRAGWRAPAHSARKASRRTARERARVNLDSALRGSTRVRQGAADQERARLFGVWRSAARERARAEQGGAPRGSTRAGQCGGPGGRTGMRHGSRTGRKHARAADGGEQDGSTRERQRAARRDGAPGRGVAPVLARPPLTGGCLPVSRMARCVRRACCWWPRGGRRGDDAASTLWTRRLGRRAGGKGDGVSPQAPAKAELQPRAWPVMPVLTVALSTLVLWFTFNRQQNKGKKKNLPNGGKKTIVCHLLSLYKR